MLSPLREERPRTVDTNDTKSLPFDQYQRYRLVADLVDRARKGDRPFRILDVGGRTALLRKFLPNDEVTLVDMEASEEPGLVLGDGSRLPFRDESFDVVAGFDTLEHVPPDRREAFVEECARLARSYVFLAGPYAAPEVDESEELLQSFLKEKLDLEHRYLEEHRDHGLPVRSEVEVALARSGATVRSYGHGNLDRWLVLMCMEMYMDHDPRLRPIAARFFRFYNDKLYASDHAEPVYRHVVVGAFGGAALPELEGLLDEPQAPAGALAGVADLGYELIAFDREKDVFDVEMKRLKKVIDDLEQDLEGHKERLADTREDLEHHRSSLTELEEIHAKAEQEAAEEKATLEADLEHHRSSLTELEGIHEQTQKDFAEEKATLEADLDEHRSSIEDYQATVAKLEAAAEQAAREFADTERELRGEIEAQERTRAELEEHLAQAEATAEEIQSELVKAQQGLEGQAAQIVEMDAEITRLRAELRNRMNNLKRALSPKKPEF